MNLQNKVYTHVAIYNDGAKDFIAQDEYDAFYRTDSEGIWVNGKYIRMSNIARIITASEYQEKYKKEQPGKFPEFPYKDEPQNQEHRNAGMERLRDILKEKGIVK